jgi:large subunit ribosomal protein L17
VTSLVLKEKIQTTVAKAKELRPLIEKYVTLGREDTVAHRRLAATFLFDKAAVSKLFTELGPRFKNRKGGYTRIVRTHCRPGDTAEMAVIEFVEKAAVNASASATEEKAAKPAKAAKTAKPKAAKKAKAE